MENTYLIYQLRISFLKSLMKYFSHSRMASLIQLAYIREQPEGILVFFFFTIFKIVVLYQSLVSLICDFVIRWYFLDLLNMKVLFFVLLSFFHFFFQGNYSYILLYYQSFSQITLIICTDQSLYVLVFRNQNIFDNFTACVHG